MRRNGFTMVELIFVIIIIGILSVAAIPKFGEVKDRAKINGEYSSLSGLDAAIISKIEFAREDHSEDNATVLWHSETNGLYSADSDAETTYKNITEAKKVLSTIVKKGDNLRIVGYIDNNNKGDFTTDSSTTFDLLMIEGAASHNISGVKQTVTGEDKTTGRPDKTDFWVFNPTPVDMNITGGIKDVKVPAGQLILIDTNDTVTVTAIKANEWGKTADKAFAAVTY